MYYEIKVKCDVLQPDGTMKEMVEEYLVENQDLFAEAEMKGLGVAGAEDVMSIKRSRVMEVANSKPSEGTPFLFRATIEAVTIGEDIKPKKKRYEVLLWASGIEEANSVSKDYISQGLEDMELVGIKKTNIVDII